MLDLPFNNSFVTHTVTFKCIGCTKELQYQEALCRAYQLLGSGNITCRLKPEPDNPVDSEAIAFECDIDQRWRIIGYVVREALKELHQVMEENEIIGVSINWIKYIIVWKSPGWFAGIDITRIGEWSSTNMKSQSARMNN